MQLTCQTSNLEADKASCKTIFNSIMHGIFHQTPSRPCCLGIKYSAVPIWLVACLPDPGRIPARNDILNNYLKKWKSFCGGQQVDTFSPALEMLHFLTELFEVNCGYGALKIEPMEEHIRSLVYNIPTEEPFELAISRNDIKISPSSLHLDRN